MIRLCHKAGLGVACEQADSCKFSHDIDAYRASKPADLGPTCPNVSAAGFCKFGVQCRFESEGHKDMDTDKIFADSEKEIFRYEGLRKKDFQFPQSKVYLEAIKSGKEIESYPFGERPKIDFKDKLYLAPLTTVGNLPFRRICKEYGVDVTCGEMAMVSNLLKGQASEWALLKRHPSEDCFGVQVCGGFTDSMTQAAELIDQKVDADFVDINMGCPIDIVYTKGMGSGLMERTGRMQQIIQGMSSVMKNKALTVKLRMGVKDGHFIAHKLIPKVTQWGATAVTIHGRTRQQRYTKEADWNYVSQCVDAANALDPRPAIIGNGDVLSWEDYVRSKELSKADTIMIARGALVKPWIFTEIKERRHYDISSSERFDMLKRYTTYALEHFGTDSSGVEKTRRFLLEWLSFLHRYVPVGLMERLPQKINQRPPAYFGRDELETLMASDQSVDWITISERLLGKAPEGFKFVAKHKSNSYGVSASDRQNAANAFNNA